MIPPTSIDGTNITGATIDGTDVTEITVDGDTVFTAGPTLPVAFSDLIAWYPFDSAEYGGANADDVTAIIGGSGDDTAYDGVVSGATFGGSDGVTDINAGANSGGFDFTNDEINTTLSNSRLTTSQLTLMAWVFARDAGNHFFPGTNNYSGDGHVGVVYEAGGVRIGNAINSNWQGVLNYTTSIQSKWTHICGVIDGSNGRREIFVDGVSEAVDNSMASGTITPEGAGSGPFVIGASNNRALDSNALVDDVRIYETALSASQINQIYTNTKP